MRQLANKLLYSELIQSCIIHDGMYYLPLDQLVTLITALITFMVIALSIGWFISECIIGVVRLITHFNKKKYGGKRETLQKGRKDHC